MRAREGLPTPESPTSIEGAVLRLDAWLDSMRTPEGYGGPVARCDAWLDTTRTLDSLGAAGPRRPGVDRCFAAMREDYVVLGWQAHWAGLRAVAAKAPRQIK